jgi:hypothetical protein
MRMRDAARFFYLAGAVTGSGDSFVSLGTRRRKRRSQFSF